MVAFPQNILPRDSARDVPDAYLLVTTNDIGEVIFDVTTTFSGVTTHRVNSTTYTRVNFPADDVYVTNINDRDKAIVVETRDDKKISIRAVNDEFRSTDGFVVLPCDTQIVPNNFAKYEYVILSTNQDTTGQDASIPRASQFLVVTCEASTRVTVIPSTTVSGSGVFDRTIFGPSSPSSSANWEIDGDPSIGAAQTLLIPKTNDDFTGTIVRGSKPLIVIAGHQCGQVPERITACDHLATQIPPHTTWGYTFLLNPLSGRQSGDFYRFATRLDNTDITITCVDAGGTDATVEYSGTINSAPGPIGSNWNQFETHTAACGDYTPKYCCLESTNPVVVAQYSYGYTRDSSCNGELSDPFISHIPPIVQFLNVYHLVPVTITSGQIFNHFYSVSVPTRYFQPASILLDDAPLEIDSSLWQAIYCTGDVICGYGITKVFDNNYHILRHTNRNAGIFVHTYGFNIQNSYAISGEQELQPISGMHIIVFYNMTE